MSMTRLSALVVVLCLAVCTKAATKGPYIIKHPPPETAYKALEDIVLPCMADPDSEASYRWEKNNVPVDLSSYHIALVQPHGSGEIIIRSPTEQDDGEYQCFASNEFGTAVTGRSVVKQAKLEPFPTVTDPTVERPTIGNSLQIPCSPPTSYPKGIAYWGFNNGSNKLEALPTNDRVLLDYEGQLYFANILASDSHDDLRLVCIVHNQKLGAYVQGNDHKIQPSPGGVTSNRPSFMYPTTSVITAVKGKNKRMKCIAAGLPTPRVTWRRIDGKTSRIDPVAGSHGTEVEIVNVEPGDGGMYECTASNSQGTEHKEIQLIVHSMPYWSHGRAPSDKQVNEEEEAEFDCSAHGTPTPNVTWGINGLASHKLPANPRRVAEGALIRFRNVQKNDSCVIQCIANNMYGTILANAYLTVISEPPSFLTTPNDTKAVVGKTVRFECRAYGAPRPKITWQYGNPPRDVSGSKYVQHDNGDLEVKYLTLNDEGSYVCKAENKHATTEARAKLLVRTPTTISPLTDEQKHIIANKTDDVILPCNVITDPEERASLRVEWRKYGQAVDYSVDKHLELNERNFSLMIRRTVVKDTAKYTCHASNDLDSAESEQISLTVKDRPDPPTNVRVTQCHQLTAEVTFTPGSYNNEPVTSYTIYYSLGDEPKMLEGPIIDRTNSREDPEEDVRARVPVRPWRTYTFYVSATNRLGVSEPSEKSTKTCVTPPMAPSVNPKNVCSKLKGSLQLVITWDKVAEEEHNGEGFHYIVSYKKYRTFEAPSTVVIRDTNLTELTIHDREIFTEYEISVWAANNMGEAPTSTRERKIGRSSEGKPKDAPQNFRLDQDKFNATYAEFYWDSVDSDPSRVQGFFRGYRIRFWRKEDPNDVRTEDVIVEQGEIDLCPDAPTIPQRRRRQSRFGQTRGTTNKLWPFSRIVAGVTTLNSAHHGDISNVIEFLTPEGPPEAVKNLVVTDVGSSHITVAWSLPQSPHGSIRSFLLEYQVAPPMVGEPRQEEIFDPTLLWRKILDLQAETTYRITLSARTDAGSGETIDIRQLTLPDSNPDEPKFGLVEAGEDHANVSFDATANPPPENPGSRFYVEYAKDGTNKWNKTDLPPHSPENWLQVPNLEPGDYYFRVVATNGRDGHVRETRSEVKIIHIGERRVYEPANPEESALVHRGASAGWFIALMCIIILLLIILLIICCIKRSKGDMYPVYEKEKMLGRDPFAPEDAPFGEYNKSGRPDHSRSQGSLDSDEKPMDSDSDSLGEYEDQDASKFNEDGSFIGLYGGKGRPRPDATSPTAMNTFVKLWVGSET
jgi:receptor-type tyrosine-protein phosphatase zeta